jgi:hypothetical protein
VLFISNGSVSNSYYLYIVRMYHDLNNANYVLCSLWTRNRFKVACAISELKMVVWSAQSKEPGVMRAASAPSVCHLQPAGNTWVHYGLPNIVFRFPLTALKFEPSPGASKFNQLNAVLGSMIHRTNLIILIKRSYIK